MNQKNKELEYKIKYLTHLLATSYLQNEHLESILLENELTIEYPVLPEEKIQNKIFEIYKLLKESL